MHQLFTTKITKKNPQVLTILSQAQALSDANTLVQQCLEIDSSIQYRVYSFENATLTMVTDNANTANKLQFQTGYMLAKLKRQPQLAKIKYIKVIVRPTIFI